MTIVIDDTNTYDKDDLKSIHDLFEDFVAIADGIDPLIVLTVTMNMSAQIGMYYECEKERLLLGFGNVIDKHIKAIEEEKK